MFTKLENFASEARIDSYLGMLKWGNAGRLKSKVGLYKEKPE